MNTNEKYAQSVLMCEKAYKNAEQLINSSSSELYDIPAALEILSFAQDNAYYGSITITFKLCIRACDIVCMGIQQAIFQYNLLIDNFGEDE